MDTVHQGDDLDGSKGVYHINAVDEVTQWEVLGATAQISEAWLLPVLDAMLAQFPFRIHGFHSDCGSEFINHTVARLLDKLRIEQTRHLGPEVTIAELDQQANAHSDTEAARRMQRAS